MEVKTKRPQNRKLQNYPLTKRKVLKAHEQFFGTFKRVSQGERGRNILLAANIGRAPPKKTPAV